jgi:hypothetical protein
VPLAQNPLPAMTLYVRSAGEPGALVVAVGRQIAAAGPQVLVSGVRTGSEIVDGGLFQARMGVTRLGVFGLLALVSRVSACTAALLTPSTSASAKSACGWRWAQAARTCAA